MSLPNLSGLSLNCAPCGVTYEKGFDSALRDAPAWLKDKEWLAEGATCAICLEPLEGESRAGPLAGTGLQNDEQIEALFELKETQQCGHVFHHTCLALAIQKGLKTCPICQVDIPKSVQQSLGGGSVALDELPAPDELPALDELPTLDDLEEGEDMEDDTGGETAEEDGSGNEGFCSEDGLIFFGNEDGNAGARLPR